VGLINKNVKNFSKWAVFSLFFCTLLLCTTFAFRAKADFTEPEAAPPENNQYPYITIDGTDQAKTGALRLGTSDSSAPYNYQLEVRGEGAMISNSNIDNNLKVSETSDTLYVDAENSKVCVGSCLGVSQAKLEVSGQGMLINAGNYGTGLYATSSDSEAIYGQGDKYGIQGLASGAVNYGILAVNTSGIAVEGVASSPAVLSSVAGISDSGIGVYGRNSNPLGLWAGYFDGRLESNADIVGAKFLAKNLQNSLVPFTSGQIAGEYPYAGSQVKLFDGTHVWLVDNNKIYKIRSTDGFQIFSASVGANPTDVMFDGNNIWVTVAGAGVEKIIKMNPYTGATVCSLGLDSGDDPRGIVFDGVYYWVISSGSGELVKLNSSCQEQDIDINDGAGVKRISITSFGDSLKKIIFNGSYLWITSSRERAVINVNPSSGEAVRWDGLSLDNPQSIFYDNNYYWVLNSGNNTVTQINLSSNKTCSESPLDKCESDLDCTGKGACFAWPQAVNTYDTSANPSEIEFDGTYFWISNNTGLKRILAADSTVVTDFNLGFAPSGLVFDGTYLWLNSATELVKIYSGSNYGITDFHDLLTLQLNNPLIQQTGHFATSGSAKIGDSSSDKLTVTGNLKADNNVWGDETNGDVFASTQYSNTWINTNGPEHLSGTYVYAVLASRNGKVYAATSTGKIFYTENRGSSWVLVGNLGSVKDLAEDSDGYLYAAAATAGEGRVYKSIDAGATWNNTGLLNGASGVDSVMVGHDGTLYAGTGNNGDVFKSTNGGLNWANTGNLNRSGEDANGVHDLLEGSDHTLYAAASNTGSVFRSTDGGTNWTSSPRLDTSSIIDSVAEAPDGTVYAAARTGAGTDLIYKTTDHGLNWSKTTSNISAAVILSMHIASNGTIFIGSSPNGNIYYSEDGGISWAESADLPGAVEIYDIIEGTDGSLYAGTGDQGDVYRLDFDPLEAGTYDCPAGHYLKNVFSNYLGQVTRLECRPL
jgi:photosystem II stability/assembly factor-like uncharacterized protein